MEVSGVQNFVNRNFQERFPFVNKVLRAYIEAMLESSQCAQKVAQIEALFDPQRDMIIFNELHPTAAQFSDVRFRHIFSYSVQRKDIYLLQLIADAFGLGGVETRYGPYLYSEVVQWTDPVTPANTDEGYMTDMADSNFPVSCFMLDFSNDGVGGVLSYNEVWKRFHQAQGLISLLKPARQPMAMILRQCFVYSFFQKRDLDLKDDVLTKNRSIIQQMTADQLRREYTSCIGYPTKSTFVKFQILSDTVRLITVFADAPTEDFIIYGNTLPNIQFQPNYSSEVFGISKNYNKFCFKLLLNLANDPKQDIFPRASGSDLVS